MPISKTSRASLVAAAIVVAALTPLSAGENYENWGLLKRTFPSTGGGGVIIDEYDPMIVGDKCVTDFTATEPSGKVYHNTVEFDAVPAQGGTLCTNGRWRARDGSMAGTTPFRVFFKDGVVRGSP
jgi:hypothetical protein